MKLELTERQAEALIWALDVFANSFEYDEEHTPETKRDIRCAAAVEAKLIKLLGAQWTNT